MIQSVKLNDKYFCAFNDSKDKKIFRLSNTDRKIFWVARIFDTTLPNFTNGRAIAPPLPPCLPVSYAYGYSQLYKPDENKQVRNMHIAYY